MIVTLTVNPAIDRNVTVDRLVFEDRAYILSTSEAAGGRGINASCVIHSFGGRTMAIAVSGGESGRRLERFLGCCGFPFQPAPIGRDIRTNLNITDRYGLTVKLNEMGPVIEGPELEELERRVVGCLGQASWLMLCGSVPPGVPPGFYARLIAEAGRQGVKTLLDTDGAPLAEGTEAGPTVVAPNQQEAERLLNTALITRTHILEAATRILAMGAGSVIVSLGSRGAVGAHEGRLYEAVPPRVDAVCPIGAGDAMAAAFVWAYRNGGDFADALRWAVAAGTASARLPGLKFAGLEETTAMYNRVELRSV